MDDGISTSTFELKSAATAEQQQPQSTATRVKHLAIKAAIRVAQAFDQSTINILVATLCFALFAGSSVVHVSTFVFGAFVGVCVAVLALLFVTNTAFESGLELVKQIRCKF